MQDPELYRILGRLEEGLETVKRTTAATDRKLNENLGDLDKRLDEVERVQASQLAKATMVGGTAGMIVTSVVVAGLKKLGIIA